MAGLSVEVVTVDRTVWEGDAREVIARTLEGELAVLPGHLPILGILSVGEVRIEPLEGDTISAEVSGGFLSVEHDRVLVVAESAEVGGQA